MKTNKNCPMYKNNPVQVAPTDEEVAQHEASLSQDDLVKVEGTKVSNLEGNEDCKGSPFIRLISPTSAPGGTEQGGGRARPRRQTQVSFAQVPQGEAPKEASLWRRGAGLLREESQVSTEEKDQPRGGSYSHMIVT